MNMTVLEQQASCLIHFPWIWDYRRTFGFEVFFREKFFEVNEASFVLLFHVITELDLRLKSGKLQRRLQGNWVIPVDNGISVNDIRLSRACLCIGSAWSRVNNSLPEALPKKGKSSIVHQNGMIMRIGNACLLLGRLWQLYYETLNQVTSKIEVSSVKDRNDEYWLSRVVILMKHAMYGMKCERL